MITFLIVCASIFAYTVVAAWTSGYIMKKIKSPNYWDHPATFFGGLVWPPIVTYFLLNALLGGIVQKAFHHGQRIALDRPKHKQVRVADKVPQELREAQGEVEQLLRQHRR